MQRLSALHVLKLRSYDQCWLLSSIFRTPETIRVISGPAAVQSLVSILRVTIWELLEHNLAIKPHYVYLLRSCLDSVLNGFVEEFSTNNNN